MPDGVYIPAAYRRAGVKPNQCACIIHTSEHPEGECKYPLDTEKRVKNAMARYNQPGNAQCRSGQPKICRAYERHGLTDTEAFKDKCR